MLDAFYRSYEKPLEWLLESDSEQPGPRYFALIDLLNKSPHDEDIRKAQKAIMRSGPVPSILAAQKPLGYWEKPGPGYNPKYTGTVWQLIFLSQYGADPTDDRVQAACEYILNNSIASNGFFTMSGAPSGFIHCLSGNLLSALITFGRLGDDRVLKSIDLVVRSILGEEKLETLHPRSQTLYYRSGTSGPTFECANNLHFPCAWGAIKTLLALLKIPEASRNDAIKRAISTTTAFLLSVDPGAANYPSVYGETPSATWFKFGYPLGYMSDFLQNIEALLQAGVRDSRLAKAIASIEAKQDSQHRWNLEYAYRSKLWTNAGNVGQPNKWITLRALRVLKTAHTTSWYRPTQK